MASNPANEIASILQSASIKRNPSPAHDINPSTAASSKIPANIVSGSPTHSRSHSHTSSLSSSASTIPSDIIVPRPRRKSFPPIPDFRFEQSYLASIKNAQTRTQVAVITIRDQVLLPLVQGIMWNTIMLGWRFWNRGAQFSGEGLGARIRKWWWDVNNWKLPVDTKRTQFAKGAEEFYVEKFGSSMGD